MAIPILLRDRAGRLFLGVLSRRVTIWGFSFVLCDRTLFCWWLWVGLVKYLQASNHGVARANALAYVNGGDEFYRHEASRRNGWKVLIHHLGQLTTILHRLAKRLWLRSFDDEEHEAGRKEIRKPFSTRVTVLVSELSTLRLRQDKLINKGTALFEGQVNSFASRTSLVRPTTETGQ